MNRITTTLILVFICFLNLNANNNTNENKLFVVYSQYCNYCDDLINNTLADKKVQETINENFDYQLIEENTEKGQELIEQYEITGFPTQIIYSKNNTVLAYGVLDVKAQLNYLSVTQELTPWEKYVFRETSLGYDEKSKKILAPLKNQPYKNCRKENKPNHYACGGIGGASYNFIDGSDKPGDFKVSIFHPLEKSGTSSVSISTFVEDGKVTQQSRCFFKRQYNYNSNESKGHYFIAKMECYVVTPKMCELFESIKTKEDFTSEKKYNEFIDLLKSEEYKEQLLEAHKYNFRNAFLKLNREQNFDYYSKLKYGFYKENMKYKDYKKSINIVNFEETDAVKNSKNFSELVSKAKDLMLKVYINPAADLTENNLIAKPNK